MKVSPQRTQGLAANGHKLDANQNRDLVESNCIRVNSCAFVVSFPLRVPGEFLT
jgi:hypothetical protein